MNKRKSTKRGKKKMGWIVSGFLVICAVVIVCILFPPSSGKIESEENLVIAEKCYFDTNDGQLGMEILACDETKPVLLVLGGGPGIPEFLLENLMPTKLSSEFVVAFIEYRGTGLSYRGDENIASMTTEQYLSDVNMATKYLKERFGQEKIYLLGHSFGSYLALKTIQQNPNDYLAYFAVAQNCKQQESEYRAYDYMYNQYLNSQNKHMIKLFEECPIKDSEEAYSRYFTSSLRDNAMHDLGVGTARNMKSVITGIFFPSLRCTAYTQIERIHIWQGKVKSNQFPVVEDGIHFDAFKEAPSIEIPIYFFTGQFDYTCAASLQQEYYNAVNAPEKQLFLFENSAHSPMNEEPVKAQEILHAIITAR